MTISYEARNLGILVPATALPIHIKGTMLSEASLFTIEQNNISIAVQQYNHPLFTCILKQISCNSPVELITAFPGINSFAQYLIEGSQIQISSGNNNCLLDKDQVYLQRQIQNNFTTSFLQKGTYKILECLYTPSMSQQFAILFPQWVSNPIITAMADTEMEFAANAITNARLSGQLWNFYIESRVSDILFHILHKTTLPQTSQQPAQSHEIQAVRKAAQLILSDLTKHITIPELAKKVQLNEFKLKKYFKEVHGLAVYEFLIHHRMQKAKDLLRLDLSIKEVAAMVGYRPSDFTVVFMQQVGSTPSAFREKKK